MDKVVIRLLLITSIAACISGVIFLGIALYAEQSLVRVLALISGSCLLLACILSISFYTIGAKRLRDRNNVDELKK